MRAFLLVLLVGACASPTRLVLRPISDSPEPTITTIELRGEGIGENCGEPFVFRNNIAEELPFVAPVFFPESVKTCSVQVEIRLFIGEIEVGRSVASLSPGQQEATLLFALCSNGASEALEACDDANLTDNDGCDSTCRPTGCASGVATPGELCYRENDDLLGPDGPLQVLAADVDGDTLPDLIAPYSSLSSPGVVRVFPNSLGGVLGAFVELPLPGVERLTLGDIDNDGDLDAVASVHRSGALPGLVILTNNDGAFSVGSETTLAALNISAVALGDIDADGRLDLVFVDKESSRVKVNLGTGAGFGSQNQAVLVDVQPIALALADVDADGDIDAITASASGFTRLLKNEGGVLIAKPPLGVGGVPSSLVLGEFDTVEGLDLAVATQENSVGKVVLFQNAATREQGFLGVADFELGVKPSALVAADFDLDGDLDLAATNQTESQIQVLFNNSTGQFDPPQDASGGLFDTRLGPVSLAVSDLNEDRVPDLIAAGQNLGVLLSNP